MGRSLLAQLTQFQANTLVPMSLCLVVLLAAQAAQAGRFINLVETAVFPPGQGEVVQATSFTSINSPANKSEILEFQAGMEYGLLPRFHVGLALPGLATVKDHSGHTTAWGGTSFWGLYNLIDPEVQGWGLSAAALYGHASEAHTGELALLVEKPLQRWLVVYNAFLGRSWARVEEFDRVDFMTHSLGLSWQAGARMSLGLEADWEMEKTSGIAWASLGRYLGPNLAVEAGPLWITAAAHFLVQGDEAMPAQIFQTQVGLPF